MKRRPKCIRMMPLIAFLLFFQALNAANHARVAVIGAVPSIDVNQDPQAIVNQVIEFWKSELAKVLPDKPDLIVLPEVCDMSDAGKEYLRVRKNQVLDYLASVARDNRCYIAFGMYREDRKDAWYNSCVMLDRKGGIAGIYDKNFPTIPEMEKGILPGKSAPLIDCDFGKVAAVICFDLNFDELREHYAALRPDLIVFSSMYHGGFVQSLWAYSCRSYFVGSVYRGNPSEVRNPMGEVVATTTNYFDFAMADINLDSRLVHLDYNWDKLTALKNKYGRAVTISDPGRLGAVLVTSEDPAFPVTRMIDEFGIELLDHYLDRARNEKEKR